VLSSARVALRWRYEAQQAETAVNLVEAGLGCAMVPSIDVALHRGRGLAAVPMREPRITCTYGLVSRRGMPLSAPAAHLRGLLIEALKGKALRHAANA
jgi:DNA-binding transcriptional LysR family regulator